MNNPITTFCAINVWTKVADSATNGILKRAATYEDVQCYETYRLEDDTAPSDISDASKWDTDEDIVINADAAIDVYIMPITRACYIKLES